MDIKQLRYFVSVVEAASFTRAASKLHVAQSALSFQIKQMEDSLGFPLLIREPAGVVPTEQGLVLLEHARIILKQLQTAQSDLQSRSSELSGEVTIGVPSAAAELLVSEILTAARADIPNIKLKITEGLSGVLDEWTKSGKFNLALQYRTKEQVGDGIEIAHEDYYLVGGRGELQDRSEIDFNEILSLPMAMPMPTLNIRKSIDDIMCKSGSSLNVRFEIDSLSTILKLVSEGKAYTVLGSAAIRKDLKLGNVSAARIVNPTLSRMIIVFTNKHDINSAKVLAARELLISVVKKLVASGQWPANLIIPS